MITQQRNQNILQISLVYAPYSPFPMLTIRGSLRAQTEMRNEKSSLIVSKVESFHKHAQAMRDIELGISYGRM